MRTVCGFVRFQENLIVFCEVRNLIKFNTIENTPDNSSKLAIKITNVIDNVQFTSMKMFCFLMYDNSKYANYKQY